MPANQDRGAETGALRLKDKQDWIDARFADGFIFRGGKVLQMRTFAERQQALDWAGLESQLCRAQFTLIPATIIQPSWARREAACAATSRQATA